MKMARLEKGIRLVLKYSEAFNRQDAAGMVQFLSDDCLVETPIPAPDGTALSGKEAVYHYWQRFFHDSPSVRIDVEEIFGLGARCVLRWRIDWVDDAGKMEHMRGASVFKVKDGAICEQLSYVKG